jgi:DNA modification methylase
MRTMADNSIDCVLTDPPYGLHFMGKDWDKFKKSNFNEKGDYKYLENCGIDNRSCTVRSIYSANANAGTYHDRRNDEFQEFMYKFGLEALRVLKPGGHMLMFGAPRRYHRQAAGLEDAGFEIRDCLMWIFGQGFPKSHNKFGLEGYGTALKPAYEPIIMAMKPLDGTYAQNAEKWGLGGINIDESRIKIKNDDFETKGRWPANIIFDEEAAQLLDEQSGILKSGKLTPCIRNGKNPYCGGFGDPNGYFEQNSGGASRFFYCAKASCRERSEGNNHPTVKPLKLLEYLLKLIMPPNPDAIVLDPFLGSGSTLVAAKNLSFNAIGIEISEDYCEIARKRIENVA